MSLHKSRGKMKILFRKIIIVFFLLILFSGNFVFAKKSSSKVLVALNAPISSHTAQPGDKFEAKTVEPMNSGDYTLPLGTILQGEVIKVKKERQPSADAFVLVRVNSLVFTDGKTYEFKKDNPKIELMDPKAYKFEEKTIRRLPPNIASAGSSIALSTASNLPGGVIFAIGTGVSLLTGAIYGAVYPDKFRSRYESAASRGYYSTSVGTANSLINKGYDVKLAMNDMVLVTFSNEALDEIRSMK